MAGKKITQYTNTVSTLTDNDLLDVSAETSPAVFESQKLPVSVLLTELLRLLIRSNSDSITSGGTTTISFSSAMTSANYEVVWHAYNSSGDLISLQIANKTVNGFDVVNPSDDGTIVYIAILQS